VVLVRGEAGMGKSSLLRGLFQQSATAHMCSLAHAMISTHRDPSGHSGIWRTTTPGSGMH
jgi:predicted GTPase